MGTSGTDSGWDEDTVIHELTHVLVGHFTFSCLSFVPLWLNEGLAVYSEGPLDAQFGEPLKRAIDNNTLLSVRSISGNFSEVSDTANLSYAQSYSLVNFLIETYGQQKMTDLLSGLRDGLTTDQALTQTYGFDSDGLEDAWRAAIGAQPRSIAAQPTAQPTLSPPSYRFRGPRWPCKAPQRPSPHPPLMDNHLPPPKPPADRLWRSHWPCLAFAVSFCSFSA
jgi:hypothetical protein